MLFRLWLNSFCLNSRWRFSSASFARLARISSFRCCIVVIGIRLALHETTERRGIHIQTVARSSPSRYPRCKSTCRSAFWA